MVKRYKIRDISQPLDVETLAAVYENAEVVLGSDYDALEARCRDAESALRIVQETSIAHAGKQNQRIAELEAALKHARPYVYNAEVADSADLEARWLVLNQIDTALGLTATQRCAERPSTSETKGESDGK